MANAQIPTAAEQLDHLLDDEGDADELGEEDRVALRAAIREGRAEIARGEGVPLDEVLAEFDTAAAE